MVKMTDSLVRSIVDWINPIKDISNALNLLSDPLAIDNKFLDISLER
ncbi:hypothetical protein XBFFL1_2670007 [Xenorhabdus bovienii str. feltiae Florida]|uniref:Uncharacterized protein n=2 Tax=Xenorhabdus bovienii TaxID=40576 RepID=A0A0B6X7W2_XENBV|nr:hypothetical protein XBFFR1_2570006 [Xenorhabdus bovienii str. feltiae France]CDG93720.1 hypothetical protein XBFFL1_2670007 [Xenorhabdus bovienii str. feltiae Florida]CDH25466.1 hypothetical protein XBKB1_4010034 [Xenorhabdus bovienii str. kraussei Becker Underwood]CDM88758.1 protein of unknown function [Xenorhabdus bovienii]